MPAFPHVPVTDLALAAAMIVAGVLLLRLRRLLHQRDQELRKRVTTLDREWALRFAHLQQQCEECLAELERGRPSPVRTGINRNIRTEALYMLRRGDPPETVAGALSIPRNEMDLLIRVQKLTGGYKPKAR